MLIGGVYYSLKWVGVILDFENTVFGYAVSVLLYLYDLCSFVFFSIFCDSWDAIEEKLDKKTEVNSEI